MAIEMKEVKMIQIKDNEIIITGNRSMKKYYIKDGKELVDISIVVPLELCNKELKEILGIKGSEDNENEI
jgi:hypothetical protein